jgi:RNA polymerase sigma factor (sigma-70 family)
LLASNYPESLAWERLATFFLLRLSAFAFSRGLTNMALSMVATDPRAALLSDRRIYDLLRKTVARRIPADHVDDVVQATILEAQASSDYPSDRAEFVRWLRLKGRSNATDWLRKQSRLARNLGARDGEDAEGVAATSFVSETDARDGLRFIAEHLREQPGGAARVRWLLQRARGETFPEIASQCGVPAKTVERAVQRLQKDLRTAWIAAIAAILLFSVLRALYGRDPQHETAAPMGPHAVNHVQPRPAPATATATVPDKPVIVDRPGDKPAR